MTGRNLKIPIVIGVVGVSKNRCSQLLASLGELSTGAQRQSYTDGEEYILG
jgi:hypothetical protein